VEGNWERMDGRERSELIARRRRRCRVGDDSVMEFYCGHDTPFCTWASKRYELYRLQSFSLDLWTTPSRIPSISASPYVLDIDLDVVS
jgi:hypothetical protein